MWTHVLSNAVAAGAMVQALPAGSLPKVALTHQGLIERYCSAVGTQKPDPAVMDAIERLLPSFAEAWARGSPALMSATVEVTGQPYRFGETVATLHACPGMESMSAPLLIEAARYVESPDSRQLRRPGHFVYTLWHEIEHRHIRDIIRTFPDGRTPLLDKYASENPVTRNHLHLFAVEKLVHARLGREDDYHQRGRQYAARGNKPYARAYQIVEQEGAETFVRELRAQ